jgi:hypothetical protein
MIEEDKAKAMEMGGTLLGMLTGAAPPDPKEKQKQEDKPKEKEATAKSS